MAGKYVIVEKETGFVYTHTIYPTKRAARQAAEIYAKDDTGERKITYIIKEAPE